MSYGNILIEIPVLRKDNNWYTHQLSSKYLNPLSTGDIRLSLTGV